MCVCARAKSIWDGDGMLTGYFLPSYEVQTPVYLCLYVLKTLTLIESYIVAHVIHFVDSLLLTPLV